MTYNNDFILTYLITDIKQLGKGVGPSLAPPWGNQERVQARPP